MKMIAKGKPTFHVIWNLFSCKKLQIFLFPTYLKNPPLARKKKSPESFPGKKGKCKLLKTLRNRRRAAICRMLRKRHCKIQPSVQSQFSPNSVFTMNRNRIKVQQYMYNVQCTSTSSSTNIWSWWESWRQVCPVLATHLSGLSPEFLGTRIKNSHSLPLPFSCAALWVNLSHSWA